MSAGRPLDESRARLRCADWTRSCDVTPAGTASSAPGGVLLVEWPRPWPADIAEIAELRPVLEAASARGVRVLTVADTVADLGLERPLPQHRIRFHRAVDPDPHTASPLLSVERTAARRDVVAEAVALLSDGDGRSLREADLVICAHGRRDVCCGGDGTRLARAMAADSRDGRRWWTSSHQGGHRFAPTMLILPEGSAWAHLDPETTRGIVDRTLEPSIAAAHHRGCTSFGEKELMALDTCAFRTAGWTWMDERRHGRRIGDDRWRIEVADADGGGDAPFSLDGLVETGTSYEVPECGSSGGDGAVATAEYAELRVQAFRLNGLRP